MSPLLTKLCPACSVGMMLWDGLRWICEDCGFTDSGDDCIGDED